MKKFILIFIGIVSILIEFLLILAVVNIIIAAIGKPLLLSIILYVIAILILFLFVLGVVFISEYINTIIQLFKYEKALKKHNDFINTNLKKTK
jgi:hypothetical protein